ncbi:Transcriptional regulator, AsnC family [Pyrodictium delaneyi]|uniref:AsnC family transcriptional regulator n=1 Tax=Pyrodictium delaneyi TaxID=1273541 RepID=A0A0P0N4S7_9CREN|nr:Lrp/AsnC ligand binding domain-containing protein [Pyrodictium delaneyi]ALL01765.1 Transcriptional regulator, AsnC family [Pyrodictium delaneyi]OWJ55223.1 AsnC family transcriptional regulator [Pyrodictium delaneyi]
MADERVVAFVLAVTEIGKEYDVAEKIREVAKQAGVDVEAYVVYGEYDVAAKIVADGLRKIDRAVTMIRTLPGVLRTVTLIAAE